MLLHETSSWQSTVQTFALTCLSFLKSLLYKILQFVIWCKILEFFYTIKAAFTRGLVSFGTVARWVRLGFAFTRDPLEPFQIELLATPKWVHLRRRSRLEPFPERSCVNGWNGSKPERLGNDTAIHCLRNKICLKRWNPKNFNPCLEKQKSCHCLCFEKYL